MTMKDLNIKFLSLLRYVPYLVDEKPKVQRFLSCLPYHIKDRIKYDNPKTLEEYMRKANFCFEQNRNKESMANWKAKKNNNHYDQRKKEFLPKCACQKVLPRFADSPFYELKLGSMTMKDLNSKFLSLLRYVPYLVDEKPKVQRFLSCLPYHIKDRIEYDNPNTLEEAMRKANFYYDQNQKKESMAN